MFFSQIHESSANPVLSREAANFRRQDPNDQKKTQKWNIRIFTCCGVKDSTLFVTNGRLPLQDRRFGLAWSEDDERRTTVAVKGARDLGSTSHGLSVDLSLDSFGARLVQKSWGGARSAVHQRKQKG